MLFDIDEVVVLDPRSIIRCVQFIAFQLPFSIILELSKPWLDVYVLLLRVRERRGSDGSLVDLLATSHVLLVDVRVVRQMTRLLHLFLPIE